MTWDSDHYWDGWNQVIDGDTHVVSASTESYGTELNQNFQNIREETDSVSDIVQDTSRVSTVPADFVGMVNYSPNTGQRAPNATIQQVRTLQARRPKSVQRKPRDPVIPCDPFDAAIFIEATGATKAHQKNIEHVTGRYNWLARRMGWRTIPKPKNRKNAWRLRDLVTAEHFGEACRYFKFKAADWTLREEGHSSAAAEGA